MCVRRSSKIRRCSSSRCTSIPKSENSRRNGWPLEKLNNLQPTPSFCRPAARNRPKVVVPPSGKPPVISAILIEMPGTRSQIEQAKPTGGAESCSCPRGIESREIVMRKSVRNRGVQFEQARLEPAGLKLNDLVAVLLQEPGNRA